MLKAKTLARLDQTWFRLLLLAVAAALTFARVPSRLLRPELYAEDGSFWLQDAYLRGVSSLLLPHTGYLQILSRLCGLLFLVLPMTQAPLLFAVVAFAVQLAPVALLLSARGAGLLPSLPARLMLVAYYVGEPNSSEVQINVTNAMWHLAVAGFLIIVLPKPRRAWAVAADLAALVLSGLSGPFALLLAPVAGWRVLQDWLRERRLARLDLIYAAAIGACAVIQAGCLLVDAGTQRITNLGASSLGLCRILVARVFIGGIIAEGRAAQLVHAPHAVGDAVAVLASFAGVALLAAAWWRGPTAYRQFVLFGALIVAGGLASPMITGLQPQWPLMSLPIAGGRYFIIAMLGWFAALLIVAARPMRWRAHWLARGLLAACVIGVVASWRCLDYDAVDFQSAARIFDNAPAGVAVSFPGNPVGWGFTLTKR